LLARCGGGDLVFVGRSLDSMTFVDVVSHGSTFAELFSLLRRAGAGGDDEPG
jgi:hypothetical protein